MHDLIDKGPGVAVCPRCKADPGPDTVGDGGIVVMHIGARHCAFTEAGLFTTNNWRCGTMQALRERVQDTHVMWTEADQSMRVLPFSPSEFLVLSIYKHRGRTEGAWIVDSGEMTPLTLARAERIIAAVRAPG